MQQQANPFDQFDAPIAPPAGQAPARIYGAPKPLDPFDMAREQRAVEDQVMQREQFNRTQERQTAQDERANTIAERNARAAERATVNALRLPGNKETELRSAVDQVSSLNRAIAGFNDDYLGAGAGLENFAQQYTGVGTPGQREWWADFRSADNLTRNALFGASLTAGEKEAYAATTIKPDMAPSVARENIKRRADIARTALTRYRDYLIKSGYGQDAIDALIGPALQPAEQAKRQTTPDGTGDIGFNLPDAPVARGPRLTPEQEADFDQFFRMRPSPEALKARYDSYGVGELPIEDAQRGAEIAAKGGSFSQVNYGNIDKSVQTEAENLAALDASGDTQRLFMQGGTFGLSDEINGAVNAGVGLLSGDLDTSRNYAIGRDATRINDEDARKRLGWAGTAAELAGGLATGGLGASRAIATPGLVARVAEAGKVGTLQGALAGYGYGQGTEGSLTGATLGGVAGGVLGSALPVGGALIRNRTDGLSRLLGRDPDLARRVVGDAITADGNNPRAVGAILDDAASRGSPLAIADTGDNARGLLGSVSRQPGGSRTLAREAVIPRQQAQEERIAGAVRRDLGDTPVIRELSDDLLSQARQRAAPEYDRFYSGADAVGQASSVKIDDLMQRPSMQRALARAARIAQEEGRDPASLGFIIGQDGRVVLNGSPTAQREAVAGARSALDGAQEALRAARTAPNGNVAKAQRGVEDARQQLRDATSALRSAPIEGEAARERGLSWQTLDYMKRGMDDVVETYRDGTTGRLNLDTEGRAVNNTLRAFINRVDRANPAYAAARSAYAGPARMRDALESGSGALNMSPDDVAAQVAGLAGDSERQMYRAGVRKAMVELLERRVDGADKVSALIGTPKKRRVLQQLFGGEAQFDRFVATLQDEAAMNRTYRSVATGSETAGRLADDAQTGDTGLLETAVDAGLRGAKEGPWQALVTGLQKLRDVERFGAGEAGKATRESISALLTETDPAVLRELLRAAQRAQARQRVVGRQEFRRVGRVAGQAGRNIGGALAPRERQKAP
ncbi:MULTISPECIES: hypothetical protein [unclassified Sphingomonas]|nr:MULTISPECIES: hypothetical protein [unclassified Sphingomonas]